MGKVVLWTFNFQFIPDNIRTYQCFNYCFPDLKRGLADDRRKGLPENQLRLLKWCFYGMYFSKTYFSVQQLLSEHRTSLPVLEGM